MNVLELRRYRLRPGRRDELIALFEAQFVESQEAVGMVVVATFTDADEPDQFVWLRGFDSMTTRDAGLRAFYGGPVWGEHGLAANATLLDNDDVFLLRPAGNPPFAAPHPPASAVLVTVVPGDGPPPDLGGTLVASLRTEPAENTFPRLPVRPEPVRVTVSAFRDLDALDRALAVAPPPVSGEHRARLQPTRRSRLGGSP